MGGAASLFFSSFFRPCSADHERDLPPCKVVFFGLATNALNVRNNNNNNNGSDINHPVERRNIDLRYVALEQFILHMSRYHMDNEINSASICIVGTVSVNL